MSGIRVTALGGLRIARDGRDLQDLPAQPVRCGVFVYLALERQATRDELATLFWPDSDSDRARHSLRQCLYELRRRLGSGALELDGEDVRATDDVVSDVVAFSAACDAGRAGEAIANYAGPFLDGFRGPDVPGFEQWMDAWRIRLARMHREACRRVTAGLMKQGDLSGALATARRWVDCEPLEDEAQHRLIELLAMTGQRSEALSRYEDYAALIARELQVEPLDETKALVAGIRSGALAAPPDVGAAPATAPQTPRAGPPRTGPSDEGWEAARERHTGEAGRPGAVTARRRHAARVVAAAGVGVVLLAAVTWLGSRAAGNGGTDGGERPLGVAVLPFINLSGDPEQDYFSDGITEDVLTSLSRIDGLRVISRASAWRFRGADLQIATAAAELGVDYLVQGTVRRDGDRVRITAQLVDGKTDSHLWADSYDRQVPGIFEIQTEIADRIAAALRHSLPRDAVKPHRPMSPEVYDLLLRGRAYLNRPGDADYRKWEPAMAFFRRVLELEPGSAQAHVGLSEAFRRNLLLPRPLATDSAREYARRALSIDPQDPAAAAALGASLSLEGRHEEAVAMFRRTLSLDANNADALAGLARLAALDGHLDRAVQWQERACAVDPFAPDRLVALGEYLFDLGDLPGARAAFRQALEFSPDFPDAGYLLAQTHLVEGDTATADAIMEAVERHAAGHPGTTLVVGRYHAQRGRHAAAVSLLEASRYGAGTLILMGLAIQGGDATAAETARGEMQRVMAQVQRRGIRLPPRPMIYHHALVGSSDVALSLIERHWRSGLRSYEFDPPEIGIYWLDAEPMLASLRDDPRFQRLLTDMRAELDSLRRLLHRQP